MRACIFALVLSSGLAQADNSGRAEAVRLKNLGATAYENKDCASALDYFQRAFRVYPVQNLRYDVAMAQLCLGNSVEAFEWFEGFLGDTNEPQGEAAQFAREQMRTIEQRLAKVTLQSIVDDVEIHIDGKSYGRTPTVRP
jgi:hypothetical protein